MRTVVLAALCGLLLPGSTRAEDKKYTLQDLEALAKNESWSELTQHLEDVPPVKRNKKWEKVAEQGSIGSIKDFKDDRNPLGGLILADGLTKRYRFLKKSKAFMKVRAEVGLKGFKACFGHRYMTDTCAERLRPFVEADAKNYALAAEAAQLAIRSMHHYWAVPYYKLAYDRGKKKACAIKRLNEAVTAALSLPPRDEKVKPAQELAKACFKQLKDAIVKEVATGSSYTRDNGCPVLKAKGVKLPKCERAK